MSDQKRLLVVFHSRSGGTERLAEAAFEGARLALEVEADPIALGSSDGTGTGLLPNASYVAPSGCTLEVRQAFEATAADVLGASAILIATPANFGYMSGAMKDFFERVYHACLEKTVRMPYAMLVKGDTDVEGAAVSVRKIATGMQWREVLPALLVVGSIEPSHIDEAHELGATLAAGMEAGIY